MFSKSRIWFVPGSTKATILEPLVPPLPAPFEIQLPLKFAKGPSGKNVTDPPDGQGGTPLTQKPPSKLAQPTVIAPPGAVSSKKTLAPCATPQLRVNPISVIKNKSDLVEVFMLYLW